MKKISLSRLRVSRILCGRSGPGTALPRPALEPQALRIRPAEAHGPRPADPRGR